MKENSVTSEITYRHLIKWIQLSSVVMLLGCVYNSEEDLMPPISTCETDNVSYSGEVLPIFENRCYKCHADAFRQGNINLEGYDRVKLLVDNGRLLGAIKHQPGFTPMPQNEGMLPECDIYIIQSWIINGAPNN